MILLPIFITSKYISLNNTLKTKKLETTRVNADEYNKIIRKYELGFCRK